MPRYARKSTSKSFRRKTGFRKRYNRTTKRSIYRLNKRISAVSRRVAGEVCKFESKPTDFSNTLITYNPGSTSATNITLSAWNYPLNTITSGTPWIMPLNWIYKGQYNSSQTTTTNAIYVDREPYTISGPSSASLKNPIWYNTFAPGGQEDIDNGTQLQYRLKYIYINALFNASISQSTNNTDGALRIVIIKDKQPTGGAATWADNNFSTNSRGVFNANRIDAQLNPNTVGRFKIMYDKTLRFNTINGYKPFKYYKTLSTVVRNNRGFVANTTTQNLTSSQNLLQSTNESPPVQKNAFYLMIFSDGLNFTYSDDSSTPAASFHLFNRVAYYNN